MKIFLDSADVKKIEQLAKSGLVDGITTNPTIILRSGIKQKDAIMQICKFVKGPISVEGIASDAQNMIEEAKIFSSWAPNVVVKIPMTFEGLKAVRELSKINIKTNVTLVFSLNQAILAAKAGASYVSPFVGRLDDASQNGIELVKEIMQVYKNYGFRTEVIVASVRNVEHVKESAKIGANICTVPPKIFEQMYIHPLTDKGIEMFVQDHKKALSEKS